MQLEKEGRDYHLVGHSHGGTVIWLALKEAIYKLQATVPAGEDPLPHLKSWTTMGTPFPTFANAPLSWIRITVFAGVPFIFWWFGLWNLLFLSWYGKVSIFCPEIGFSVLTSVGLVITLVIWGIYSISYSWDFWRYIEYSRERKTFVRVWGSQGSKWLGLFSQNDEAIAGCALTVGLYASNIIRMEWQPFPKPIFLTTGEQTNLAQKLTYPLKQLWEILVWVGRSIGWCLRLPAMPFMNYLVFPMAEWVVSLILQAKAQSTDRWRTVLVRMSPDPVDYEQPRGWLPPSLAKAIDRQAEANTLVSVRQAVEQFACWGRNEPRSDQAAQGIVNGLELNGELIHNSYDETPEIRDAIAFHILQKSNQSEMADEIFVDGSLIEWLKRDPGNWDGQDHPASAPHRPVKKYNNNTPWITRILLATLFLTLAFISFSAAKTDVQYRYAAWFVEKLKPESQLDNNRKQPIKEDAKKVQPLIENHLVATVEDASLASRVSSAMLLRDFPNLPTSKTIEDLAQVLSREDLPQVRREARWTLKVLLEKGSKDALTAFEQDLTKKNLVTQRAAFLSLIVSDFDTAHQMNKELPAGNLILDNANWAIYEDFTKEWALRFVGQAVKNDEIKRRLKLDINQVVRDLTEIIKLDKNSNVRRDAAETLGEIGEPAVPALIQALQDNNDKVRRAAAVALGQIGEPAKAAVPELINALKDNEYDVRYEAYWALNNLVTKIKLDKEYQDLLASLLLNKGSDTRRYAAILLGKSLYKTSEADKTRFDDPLVATILETASHDELGVESAIAIYTLLFGEPPEEFVPYRTPFEHKS